MCIPSHFFISYTAEDQPTAMALQEKLKDAGIPFWIDALRVAPGTPDWETSIRDAMASSFGVVMLASPASRSSFYVRGELALAQSLKIEIIPLWIQGDDWPTSVPLNMAYSQYIDCRNARRDVGFNELVTTLDGMVERMTPPHYLADPFRRFEKRGNMTHITISAPPPGFVSVELPRSPDSESWESPGKAACFQVKRLASVQQLLDELYVCYLRSEFEPFTYGKGWVLISYPILDCLSTVLAPWSWLSNTQNTIRQSEDAWGGSTPLNDARVTDGSMWLVVRPNTISPFGIAIDDIRVIDVAQRYPKAKFLLEKFLTVHDPAESIPHNLYRFVVVGNPGYGGALKNSVLVQTVGNLGEAFERFYKKIGQAK
jgi:hypothetical protein